MRTKLFAIPFFISVFIMFSSCEDDTENPPEPSSDYTSKVLLRLDASDTTTMVLNGEEIESWSSTIGNATAIADGEKFTYNDTNQMAVCNFRGSLGVNNLGATVHGFFLVGRIMSNAGYSVILGYAPEDNGTVDSRYLIREHSTMAYGKSPMGYFNDSTERVSPFPNSLPGHSNTHLFYADVNDNDVSNTFYLGSKGNGQDGTYAYKEIVVVKEALSELEKEALVNELLNKWGLN